VATGPQGSPDLERVPRAIGQGGIPKQIFFTHPSDEDRQTLRDLHKNVRWIGKMDVSSIHFFDDERMAASACYISRVLAKYNVTGAYDAFAKLRPGAYRADLWRYMALWMHGGVFMDIDLRVNMSFDSWLPFNTDRLVVVHDMHCRCYWNAVMASPRRSPALLEAIQVIVQNVLAEKYGKGTLDITGPSALWKAVAHARRREEVYEVAHAYRLTKCRKHALPPPFCGERLNKTGTERVAVYTDDATQTRLHDPEKYYAALWEAGRVFCTEDDPCQQVAVCET